MVKRLSSANPGRAKDKKRGTLLGRSRAGWLPTALAMLHKGVAHQGRFCDAPQGYGLDVLGGR
jgi:hypothetical protein